MIYNVLLVSSVLHNDSDVTVVISACIKKDTKIGEFHVATLILNME